MKLMHFCGHIVELEVLDVEPFPMLRMEDGDLFGPIVAGMMFWEFPRCVVEINPDEEELLKKGGFFCQ